MAIVVWFKKGCHLDGPYEGRPIAAFRTTEEGLTEATKRQEKLMKQWCNDEHRDDLLPPHVLDVDHPNHELAIESAELWPD